MYQIVTLDSYFEKKSRKEQLNEKSNTFYINTDLLSYVRNIDIRNIEIWILKGEGMTVDERKARVEEIRQKVLAFGEAQYLDAKNQNEVQYRKGYQQGVNDTEKKYDSDAITDAVVNEDWENVPERLNTYLDSIKDRWFEMGENKGYTKGLEDMWEVLEWSFRASLGDKTYVFPEYKNNSKRYADLIHEDIGLVETIKRVKKVKEKDTQLLYSTISDLKLDYTNEQILKAIQDNGIEVNNK